MHHALSLWLPTGLRVPNHPPGLARGLWASLSTSVKARERKPSGDTVWSLFSGNCPHTNFENVILWVWLNSTSSLQLKTSISWVASCRRPGTPAAAFFFRKIKELGWSKQRKMNNKTLLTSSHVNTRSWTEFAKIPNHPNTGGPTCRWELLVTRATTLWKESLWISKLIFKYFIGKCQLARNELRRLLN